MTSDELASIAAIVTSLIFAYLPGAKDWYGARDSTQKRGIMALLLIVIAVAAFGLSCGQVLSLPITCDKAGALGLVQVLISALIANQAAYVLLVKPSEGTVQRA